MEESNFVMNPALMDSIYTLMEVVRPLVIFLLRSELKEAKCIATIPALALITYTGMELVPLVTSLLNNNLSKIDLIVPILVIQVSICSGTELVLLTVPLLSRKE